MAKSTKHNSARKDRSEVSLSAPWQTLHQNGAIRFSRGSVDMQTCRSKGELDINDFVKERSIVHVEYIRQAESTKRWAMAIGCLCVTISAIILVFAPDGRETVSYLISLALLIISGGAFGYGRVWFKNENLEIGASNQTGSE